jgi:Cof subfamily protein (haloacid dehalogenase superfamily)
VVCDLDRTLIADDLVIRPRTQAAIDAARAAGIRVLIATGRMFRSVRPYALAAGGGEPVICYQGAAVVNPLTGEFLRHEPIPLSLAREAIGALEAEGFQLNVYVDDELFVASVTPEAERYARFQKLDINPVGSLLDWLAAPPTKLVVIGEPGELDSLEERLKARFRERLFIAKSLPIFLELAQRGVTKGSGLAFAASHLGFALERTVAFGDGENDVELLEAAGYGVAVEGSHPRLLDVADWLCPPAEEEGVAQVIEAMLA